MRYQRLLLVLSLAVTAAGQGETSRTEPSPMDRRFKIGIDVRLLMGIFQQPFTFENVPVAVRQVPGHPDDFVTPPLITIPFASISTNRNLFDATTPLVGPEVQFFNRVAFRAGIQPYLVILPTEDHVVIDLERDLDRISRPNFREINLQGLPNRGYGTSLVYYEVVRKSGFHPGFYGEAEVRIATGFYVLAGAMAVPMDYHVERGYDRYNALAKLDNKPFAHIDNFLPYVGLRIEPDLDYDWNEKFRCEVLFYGGPIIAHATFDPSAAGVRLHAGSGFRIGVSLGIRFTPLH